MLTAFSIREGRLQQHYVARQEELDESVIWVDLMQPTPEERSWVEKSYTQALPTPDELSEIEASARCYEDEDGLHVHAYFLQDSEQQPHNVTVAFTLKDGRLFTLHDEDILSFRVFRMRARRQPGYAVDAPSILQGLFEVKVERLADTLEQMHTELEAISGLVFSQGTKKDLGMVLQRMGAIEDLNGKTRLSMMDKQRVLSYLLRRGTLSGDHVSSLREILNDLKSLIVHSTFLFEKTSFLLNSTMGLINIEQNQIIKIFSIVAVIFLPPTLVASIYGMNFHWMPELSWKLGYPFALALIIAAAYAPYWIFKRKGWL